MLDSSSEDDDFLTKQTGPMVEVDENSDESDTARKGFVAEQLQLNDWEEGTVTLEGFEDEDIDSEGDGVDMEEDEEDELLSSPRAKPVSKAKGPNALTRKQPTKAAQPKQGRKQSIQKSMGTESAPEPAERSTYLHYFGCLSPLVYTDNPTQCLILLS